MIYALDVVREGDMIRIRVQGNGFLYNMVRIIAGTLIQVGAGIKSRRIWKASPCGKGQRIGRTDSTGAWTYHDRAGIFIEKN